MKNKVKGAAQLGIKTGTLVLLLATFSCRSDSKKQAPGLENLHWLEGTWQQRSEAGTLTETWRPEGRVLTGKSYLLDGRDTVFSESLRLETRDGEIFYVPVIADQNKGEAVLFKLVSSANGKFVFENKAHDFPQRIIYRQLSPDSLLARIEGEVKGELKFEEFKMKKVK